MTRSEILDCAKRIVTKDRQDKYGDAEDNFQLIADLWTVYTGHKIFKHDVPIMMCLLKIARIQSGDYNEDNYVDIAGYIACGGEIAAGRVLE